jgi:hypothetical protein
MKTYCFTVARTTVVHATIFIEGTDEASARERFQHQLETRCCPGIEDGEKWGEAEYYQVHQSDPYEHDYEIVDCHCSETNDCPHCGRDLDPGESLCGDSDCPRHDEEIKP